MVGEIVVSQNEGGWNCSFSKCAQNFDHYFCIFDKAVGGPM